MAKILKGVNLFKGKPNNSNYAYPWGEWLDGKTRELKFGKDFFCSVLTIRSAAYQAAKRAGVDVTVRFVDADNGVVRIQSRKKSAE